LRIVVNDHQGHAPQVQLSRALAARGHDVLFIYSGDVQTPKADYSRKPEDAPGLTFERIDRGRRASASFLSERIHETRLGRVVAKRALAFRPDVLIASHNPLDIQREVQRACRHRNIPFVYWMQDFYATRIDRLVADWNAPVNVAFGSYYHWLERSLLQRSSAVVALAYDHLAILAEVWGVYDRQCMVVPNWAPLDSVTPGPKINPWSQAYGLENKKVVLYAGSLKAEEDPMRLRELAQNLSSQPDVTVVVVSDEEGSARLADEARTRGISNLFVLPFQPYQAYGEMLASADVLLGIVGTQAGIVYAPSKICAYLCAGRPIILAAPWQNVAAQLVRDSGSGVVVPPDKPAALGEAILRYLNDEGLRARTGEKARLYAEQAFDITKITDRFERLFERLSLGPPRQRQQRSAPQAAKAAA
jgi:colanic acid biosynthesis glycosyl transferase WcaI